MRDYACSVLYKDKEGNRYKTMQCKWDTCSYNGTSLKDLCDHVSVHSGIKPFICFWENCGQVCQKKGRLRAHIKTHVPYKEFKCKICQKAFRRQQEMKRHYVNLHLTDQILLDDIASMTSDDSNTSHAIKGNQMSITNLLN